MLRQLRRLFKYSLLFLILFFLINYSLNIPNNLIKLNWISKNRPRSIEELETEARLNHYLSRINSALVGSEEINQRLTDISNLIVEDVSKEHPNLVFTEKEIKKMNLLLAAAKKGGSSSAISPPHANSGRLKFPPEPPVVPEISTTKLQNKREKSPSVTSAPKSSYSSLKPSDVILENENSPDKNQFSSIIPTIVFACNRDTVSRSLDKLLISRSHFINNRNLPIIVSQDTCDHQGTKDMILKYVKENENVYYLEQTDRSDPAPELNIKSKRFQLGYFKLARHYKSGINSIFNNFAGVTQNEYSNTELKNVSPNHVIIMEDDLEVSEDFYTFMIAGSQILDANPNLYCVSAWNDNGKPDFIDNSPKANFKMHYSDFFSGLGWILKKNIWEEWESKWPKAYWDDWVRLPEQRLNRACLRPEVSRTYTFGKKGVSNGQFFEKHLKYMKLADTSHENFISLDTWSKLLLPLKSSKQYNNILLSQIKSAKKISATQLRDFCTSKADDKYVLVEYNNEMSFKSAAKAIGIMSDSKSGVPRTAYLGVVQARFKECERIFIAPPMDVIESRYLENEGYDTKWKGQP